MIAVVDYKMGNLLSVERGVRAALDALGQCDVSVKTTSDAGEIARAGAIVLPGVGAFADAAASMNNLGQMSVIKSCVKEGVPFLGICLGLHLLCEFGVEGAVDAGGEDDSAKGACGSASGEEGGENSADCAGGEDDNLDSARNRENLAAENPKIPGMGFIKQTANHLPSHDEQGNFYKVPHVGWDTVCPYEKTIDKENASVNLCADNASSASTSKFGNSLFEGINPGEYFYFTHSYYVPVCAQTIAVTSYSVEMSSAVQVAPRAFAVQFHPEKSSDVGAQFLKNFVQLAL